MWFKQYNYKPRSNSQSSQGSTSTSGSPPKEDTKVTAANANPGAAGRRRSSTSEKFAGLTGQKRNNHDDRKANWAEQKPGQPGILGGMWQNFTKGS
ncbi:uncharacterized protein A1O5_12275 [Cladophialophora psammophila CBS 110553]|uniref:Uncharacterized protein n=1 Tax=Cladophialophora psammophila CBS 110553 TaxID=1182543 RepID=W9WLT6_9EURO|nr:uncharacterized protein A1O5_12275 [Cladophialophora psammophila CBS 110553]EXJ59394.1 hypothetical protein A1O5_12275 [Cladophialophora psammophila CBS 110553]